MTAALEDRRLRHFRRLASAVGVLAALSVVGTVGYLLLGLDPLDAVYQTIITLSTVGFGEITGDEGPTNAYRGFTIVLVIGGTGTALYAASIVVETLVNVRLDAVEREKERRMSQEINELSGHLIVCGYGRMGQAVCHNAAATGSHIIIVDTNPQTQELASHHVVIGDATMDDVLRDAGVERAAALITVLSDDADNLFVAFSARRIAPDLRIGSRANFVENIAKLRAIDVDTIVDPYEIAGARLAASALRPHASAYLESVLNDETEPVSIEELVIEPGSALDGEGLSTATDAGLVVLAVRDRSGTFARPERLGRPLRSGDVLIAIGADDALNDARIRASRS